MTFAEILFTSSSIIIIIVVYFKWAFTYWARKQLQCIEPRIPFGNASNFFTDTKSRTQLYLELYEKCRKLGWKHAGVYMFSTPIYLPVDPSHIKQIMAKDFQHFTIRGTYSNEKDQPISAHLLALDGAKWKNLRTKLTPTFSLGKMKLMAPLVVQCSEAMVRAMDDAVEKSEPVDIKEIAANFTTDAIGTCAFGLELNSHKNSEIRKNSRLVFPASKLAEAKVLFCIAFPNLARSLGLCVLDKKVESFFDGLIRETVLHREVNNLTRNDFLQLLINLKNSEENKLTMNELIAECFVFFMAGFETSSTTITFGLYEMALNQEIQDKARQEVLAVLEQHNGKITYEGIGEMKYLQQVLQETLRKYPPAAFISRQCTKTYEVPNTDVVIEEGTFVGISVVGLHHDSEYFPEPQVFDPERFSEENKKTIREFTYLPFGEGPRMCIGLKFGEIQTKICLALLLKNYRFSLNLRTKVPLEMSLGKVTATKGGVWLDATKIIS